MKQAEIDRNIIEETGGRNRSSHHFSVSNKIPVLIAIVMLIMSFVFLFIVFKPVPVYITNNETLIREVLEKIQTMEEPLPISEKEYSAYRFSRGDTPGPNCVDYSLAFAAYYGPDAKIIFNDHHCWIKIGSTEIEPQQNPQGALINVAKNRGMYYIGAVKTVSLKEEHRKLIKDALK